MFNTQPRKTSIPIHFRFAHYKRSTPSPKNTTGTLTLPPRPKRRPPSIIVPHNTPVHRILPTAVQPEWTPVEISNFPPQLRHTDFVDIFKGWNISPEFTFPDTPRFTHPLRTTVLAAGVDEARRMVKELDKMAVAGRSISVKMIANVERYDQDVGVQDVVDELKNSIINTARVYFPSLSDEILEVCELVHDKSHFAFLQKRARVTVRSNTTTYTLGTQNKADWEFVAGALADFAVEEKVFPRLDALKSLQKNVETQGVLGEIWSKWDGSRLLLGNAL